MIAIFIGYLALTMLLGLWQASRTKSQADFISGSSKLPGWMLALSERATGESAWLLLGFTGFVYATGLSAIWTGIGCLIGIGSAWIILARKFRREAEKYGAMTMPEYFSAKFPEKANAIRVLSTIIIVFFFVFYVSAQFAGAGKTIFQTFGFDPFWGQIIAAAVILGYASFGGFISVVAVDAFQSILMIVTLVVTPVILLGLIISTDASLLYSLSDLGQGMNSMTGAATGFAAGLLIFNNLAWVFGYLGGQPQLNARFMSMRDDRNVAIGRNIAVTWTVLAYSGVVIIGLSSLVLFGPNVVEDPEMILPHVLTTLFPWWLAAILLAGAVAAMISTAQSMLLVAASSISQDIYGGIIKKGNAHDKTALTISRVSTLVIGLIGLVLSLTTEDLIFYIVGYAWAGIGCSFAPAVLLSFYWDRFGSIGIVTALGSGLLTTIFWIVSGLDDVITARAITFIVAMTAAVLVTIFSKTEARRIPVAAP